ncbi:MAG: molybdopterin-dependent oxidoreductase [Myxococcota bacterium]
MSQDTSLEARRQFLRTMVITGSAALVPACTREERPPPENADLSAAPKPPSLPDGIDPEFFVQHSKSPLALEVRRSAIGAGVITPVSRFFVRNNLPMPSESIVAHADSWVLEIEGTRRPDSMSLAQLKGLGLETEGSVIQCSGNGRAFFDHAPSGSEWGTGAAGCALWTGVRVKTLLEHLGGVAAGMKFFTSTGGETLPEGMDRDELVVERSIPIDKALEDALLAWEMNGAPIPLTHGGPLRLIVPGYYGCNNIKYVKRIACTESESQAKIHQTGYRYRPIGKPGGPEYPSMWRMPVKSWVNGPGADDQPTLAGEITFYGVALSGERGVRRVEVSLDSGKTWSRATLEGPDLGPNAWRVFSYTTALPAGAHTIVSRATDTRGDTQPRERDENERGYGHNGWLDAALTVNLVDVLPDQAPIVAQKQGDAGESEPRKEVALSEAGEAGKEVFAQAAQPPCGVCHTLSEAGTEGVVGPNLDDLKPDVQTVEAAVTTGVGAMPAYGTTLTPTQIKELAAYVVESTR